MDVNQTKQYLALLDEVFANLAQKIGTATQQVLPYLIKQVWVDTFCILIWVLSWAILLFFSTKGIKKGYSNLNNKDKRDEKELWKTILTFSSVCTVISILCLIICSIMFATSLVQVWINPEYAGLEKAIQLIQGFKGNS